MIGRHEERRDWHAADIDRVPLTPRPKSQPNSMGPTNGGPHTIYLPIYLPQPKNGRG
jgi:hypothetical protein